MKTFAICWRHMVCWAQTWHLNVMRLSPILGIFGEETKSSTSFSGLRPLWWIQESKLTLVCTPSLSFWFWGTPMLPHHPQRYQWQWQQAFWHPTHNAKSGESFSNQEERHTAPCNQCICYSYMSFTTQKQHCHFLIIADLMLLPFSAPIPFNLLQCGFGSQNQTRMGGIQDLGLGDVDIVSLVVSGSGRLAAAFETLWKQLKLKMNGNN